MRTRATPHGVTSSRLVLTWSVIAALATVVQRFDHGWLVQTASLAPERIFHGQIWRLGTWVFVHSNPLGMVLFCYVMHRHGTKLAERWGERRLRRFLLQVLIAASAVATVGALFSEHAWHMSRADSSLVADIIVIAWARQFPMLQVTTTSVRISSRWLIAGVLAWTFWDVVEDGIAYCAPELVGILFAMLYPSGWLGREGR